MSVADIIQIITAVGTLAGVLAGIYVSLRNGAKSDVIAGHVNSAATAATAKIEGLQKELKLLQDVMAKDNQRAALLAQALATKSEPVAAEVKVINSPEDPAHVKDAS